MNLTVTDVNVENSTVATDNFDNVAKSEDIIFDRHEFLTANPWTAIPSIIILSIASAGGTFGNVLTLLAIATCKKIRNVESIFIINLAISDLYVTAFADPMSVVAKLEGEAFFNSIPGLCQAVANLCTISCVTSLMTIAMMSLNRFICVCHQDYYKAVFSKRNCIIMCLCLYLVGLTLVLLNQAGIGDHNFDRKSLECIFDRMATFPFTVVFSIVLVWVPCLTIGICYLRLYIFVRSHKQKMARIQNAVKPASSEKSTKPRLQLAKTLFIIYAVFVTCWAPYALLIVVDVHDTFPHEVHVYITMFAHLHPSVNWLIYYFTQKKFAEAYRHLLRCCIRRKSKPDRRMSRRLSVMKKSSQATEKAEDTQGSFDSSDVETRQSEVTMTVFIEENPPGHPVDATVRS